MKNLARETLIPFLTALIWGTAFTAQGYLVGKITPFYVNGIRSLTAFLILFVVCLIRRLVRHTDFGPTKDLLKGGIAAGVFLGIAVNFQQFGIETTSSGKAGFITSLYMVIVPVLSILIGKKVTRRTWIALAVAVAGLYFLCIKGEFTLAQGDIFLVICSFAFAGQMILSNVYSQKVDVLALTGLQLGVSALISLVCALRFEDFSAIDLTGGILPLLYLSVMSSCVANVLCVWSLGSENVTLVTMILCLESVVSVVAGALILGESMTGRELLGCALMFGAIILAKLPERKRESAGIPAEE